MRRGDVYWCDFRPPDRRRPVVVLTRSSALGLLSSVTVAPITRSVRDLPTMVPVGPGDGLPVESAVNLEGIQTVGVERLRSPITTLSPERMREVRAAIEFALGFDEIGP